MYLDINDPINDIDLNEALDGIDYDLERYYDGCRKLHKYSFDDVNVVYNGYSEDYE